ncbi:YitT family protein [Oscillibacter sp.]|uniref:YitT family protein n=1 Tax=Oscillibacter sp. TaxID=1945593 RepID=UPI002DBD14A8|nr:YitT family protein [Oscillibacter sp.]
MKNVMKTMKTQLHGLRPMSFLLLFAAGVINAVGVTMFLAPVHLYDSGISGTSMLLWQITPEAYTLSLFLLLLNVPLFLFGLKKQGIVFTIYSIWAVFVYSAASFIITDILPVDVSAASPFAGQDLLLCALFGGLISGIGSGMTIRFGGAIDGIEVMAVIFAKRLGLTVGSFVMAYNVLLYIVIGCVFRSWILPLYSIVTYCAAIKAVDFIVEGLDKAKSAMIVTTKADAISNALSDAFGRGITHIGARGYYSGTDQTIIYFVVNRFQIAKMKALVTEVDPDAFITISEVSDVLGRSVQK